MPVQKEASHLWLFESHSNSKRSQWLQSTLSELEEKTKAMLKLIEGDADTFAQRAEMYYKKRPELVNMIEDFYRSYRSLAERHELLKLESGNSFSNRRYLNKDWSFIDKSSASSSVICDSESEVDDPSEEEQVESKLREVPRNKNGNDLVNMKHIGGGEISQAGIKRERSDLSTYSIDSEISEVSSLGPEETEVESKLDLVNMKHIGGGEISQAGIKRERSDLSAYSIDSEISEVSSLGPEETKVESKLEEFLQKKSDICVVKQMIEKVESTEDKARAAADNKCFEHSDFHCKPKEGQDENNLAEFPEKGDSSMSNSNILAEEAGRIPSMIKKMAERSQGSSFEDLRVLRPEREETQGEHKLKEAPEKKRDNPETNSNILTEEAGRIQSMIKEMAERSQGSSFEDLRVLHPEREETQGEHKLKEAPEKKHNILTEEAGRIQSLIKKMAERSQGSSFEDLRVLHPEREETQGEHKLKEAPEKKHNILTEEAGRIQSMIKKLAERSQGSSFEDLRVLHPEREETQGEHKLKEAPEKKRDNPKTKLMSVVERLKGENMTFKAELERKDEEKREVIRQLSLSIDLLKGENDSMKKFIRDSKNRNSLFEFGKLKGVFFRKLFASQSKFPTTLVAL